MKLIRSIFTCVSIVLLVSFQWIPVISHANGKDHAQRSEKQFSIGEDIPFSDFFHPSKRVNTPAGTGKEQVPKWLFSHPQDVLKTVCHVQQLAFKYQETTEGYSCILIFLFPFHEFF